MTTEEAKRILEDIMENDPEAHAELQDKCNWEHMTAIDVIEIWGDPRKW